MCRVGCAPVGSPRLAWLASSLLFSWVALRENFCQVAVQPWILLNPSPLFEHLPVRGWGGGGCRRTAVAHPHDRYVSRVSNPLE